MLWLPFDTIMHQTLHGTFIPLILPVINSPLLLPFNPGFPVASFTALMLSTTVFRICFELVLLLQATFPIQEYNNFLSCNRLAGI